MTTDQLRPVQLEFCKAIAEELTIIGAAAEELGLNLPVSRRRGLSAEMVASVQRLAKNNAEFRDLARKAGAVIPITPFKGD